MRFRSGLADLPDADEGPEVDPLADLLFTLIAAVLPAIFLLAPLLHAPSLAEARTAGAVAVPAPQARVSVDGQAVQPIIAGADGLHLTADRDRVVLVDAIPDDAGLGRWLDSLRDDGRPLLLIVEPDGFESDFVLEPVLAAHGLIDIHKVRTVERCTTARDAALRQACAARAAAQP